MSDPETTVRRRGNTRRRLIDAAAHLFEASGTIAQSVEDISRQAGFTRGAFYSNFATVEQIYLALHQEQAAVVWGRLGAALDAQLSGDHAGVTLDEAVGHLLASIPESREWFSLRTVLLSKAAADPSFARNLMIDGGEAVSQLGERFAALAALHGRVPVVEASVLAKAVVSAHVGAVSLSPVDTETADTQRVVVAAVLRGLTVESPAASPPA